MHYETTVIRAGLTGGRDLTFFAVGKPDILVGSSFVMQQTGCWEVKMTPRGDFDVMKGLQDDR
jgi:hypothetical protein